MGQLRVAIVGVPDHERKALRSALGAHDAHLAPLYQADLCIAGEHAVTAVLDSRDIPVLAWKCASLPGCAGMLGIEDLDHSLQWILGAALGNVHSDGSDEPQDVRVRALLDCAIAMAGADKVESMLFRESDGEDSHVHVLPERTVARIKVAISKAMQNQGAVVLKTEHSGDTIDVRVCGYPTGYGAPFVELIRMPGAGLRVPQMGSINSGWNWHLPNLG